MKPFRKFNFDLTVAQRLTMVMSVMLAGFALVGATYFLVEWIDSNAAEENDRVSKFGFSTDMVSIQLLEARRREKEFLLQKDVESTKAHKKHMTTIYSELDKLKNLAKLEEEKVFIGTLRGNIGVYQKEFEKMVKARTKLGLDYKSGFLGEMREAAIDIEQILEKVGNIELMASLLLMRRYEKDYLSRLDPIYVSKVVNEEENFNAKLRAAELSEDDKAHVQRIMKVYHENFLKMKDGNEEVEREIAIFRKAAKDAEPVLAKLHKLRNKEAISNQENLESTRTIVDAVFIAMLLTVFLAIAAVVFTLRKIVTKSLAALKHTVAKMAEGDFSTRVQLDSKDEFGDLGNAFNNMMDERAKFMKTEEENEMLNDSILDLVRAVSKLGKGNLTITAPVNEDITGALGDAINNMAEGIAKTLGNVDAASQQVRLASGEVKSITEKSKQAVLGAAQGMTELRGTIQETAKRIKRLGERSQEIGGIINLIDNIAERTNVLALNANMQAAAAGDAGRGFMVVADEVQRLAESSKQATDQISKLVSSIQVETSDTISTMDKAIGEVVQGGEIAEQAAAQMDKTELTVVRLDGLGTQLLDAVHAFELPESATPVRASVEPLKTGTVG